MSDPAQISESYNRAATYLYIINGKEFAELFNGAKYTSEQRKDYNLKKNDRPTFLNLMFKYKLEDEHGKINDISLPVYLGKISKNEAPPSLSKVSILYDVKVRDLPNGKDGELLAQVLSHNNNTAFWKGAFNISKDLVTSAAMTASGNIPGTLGVIKNSFTKNSLTKSLNQQLDYGIRTFDQAITNIGSDKQLTTSFLVPLITPRLDNEKVYAVTLYQIRWNDGSKLPEQKLFESLVGRPNVTVADFEQVVANHDAPLIMVVETRSLTKIPNDEPKFTEEYRDKIKNEFLEHAPPHDVPFIDYFNNFQAAFASYNYLNRINALDDPHSWDNFVEAINNYYLFKQGERKNFTSQHPNSMVLRERYRLLDKALLERFGPIDGQKTAIARPLLEALTNEKNSLTNVSDLTKELAILNEYKKFASNSNLKEFEKKNSYERYLELKDRYEKDLAGILIKQFDPNQSSELEYYQTIAKDYQDYEYCRREADKRIFQLTKNTIANLRSTYNDRRKTLLSDYKELRDRYSQFAGAEMDITAVHDTLLTNPEREIKNNLEVMLTLYQDHIETDPQDMNKQEADINKWLSSLEIAKRNINTHLGILESRPTAARSGNVVELNNPIETISPPEEQVN